MAEFSKAQIDRLGDRLRDGPHSEADLRMLSEYRLSFGHAAESVLQVLRDRSLAPTGRTAKSTLSIIEKLRRESIRLSQMQDIAGCRVVVADVVEQDQLVQTLKLDFAKTNIFDRRAKPSHGYRAVHMVVLVFKKPIEIQVRSSLQHAWSELSEKASDVVELKIKYGGGPKEWKDYLNLISALVELIEDSELERNLHETAKHKGLLRSNESDIKLERLRQFIPKSREVVLNLMKQKLSSLDEIKGRRQ